MADPGVDPGRSRAVGSWLIDQYVGGASAFHRREPATSDRRATWVDVDRPAIVLGSAQPDAVVDREACAEAGVDVVRRRSGGGVVLLVPGEFVWLDLIVPHGDPLWHDDIGRSMWWFGEVWAEALIALGMQQVDVHHGSARHTDWSRLVCFDGLGAGEVTVGGSKAVGISQRRTRDWARLQSSVHLAGGALTPVDRLVPLLAPPHPTVAQLQPVAQLDVPAGAVRATVEAAFTAR